MHHCFHTIEQFVAYLLANVLPGGVGGIKAMATFSSEPSFRALGYNDDVLTENSYDWSWILMMISGIFFTFGSATFLCAVNDPPVGPFLADSGGALERHFGDELLDSWNFFFAASSY